LTYALPQYTFSTFSYMNYRMHSNAAIP